MPATRDTTIPPRKPSNPIERIAVAFTFRPTGKPVELCPWVIWMLNEASGDFQGIYEWDSVEHAKNYANSFAMKFMTMRFARGSVSYVILPKQDN